MQEHAGSRHLVVRHGSRDLTGVVRPGESWWHAARRVAATVPGTPRASDLSGDPLVFAVEPDLTVVVRAATPGDLPILVRWRQDDEVRRWWQADGEPTVDRVTAQYAPRIDGQTPTRLWVAEVNGRSVGFVQDYRLRDYPQFALLAPDPDAIGVDYALGEPHWRGKGHGVRMLWAWLLKAQHRFPDAARVFAAPDHRNDASLRLLDKLGFRRGLWFDEPRAGGAVVTVVGCTLDVGAVLG